MRRLLNAFLTGAAGALAFVHAAAAQPVEAQQLQTAKSDFSSIMARGAASTATARAAAGEYPLAAIATPHPSPSMTPEIVMARIELAQSALKVKTLHEYQASLRLFETELRAALSNDQWPYTVEVFEFDISAQSRKVALTRPQEAQFLLAVAESRRKTASDMAQLAQIEMQNTMQKHQQTLNLISSIMKQQHETMRGIIDNLK